MSENNNPWIENTGTVPDEVGPDTLIEVEYRYGEKLVWLDTDINTEADLWIIDDCSLDIIRWRLV